MGLVFFKINKHKKYNYKPVFYDPNKEEELNSEASNGQEQSPEILKLKESIQKQWHKSKKSKSKKYSPTTIVLILVILLALVYLLMK